MSNFSEITPDILAYTKKLEVSGAIDPDLYRQYEVKRGLRDLNGQGVLAGLTEISEICSFDEKDGQRIPCEGQLFYRGINIADLVRGFLTDNRFGFDEAAYLLLFGSLPDAESLRAFSERLVSYRSLPTNFVRDIILKAPSHDMMNTLARGILTLYAYDDKADDISIPNVLRQCLQLISIVPMLSVYGYQAYSYYHGGNSLFIHAPNPELSTSENLLHLLRPDSKYTALESRILDLALVLHMEHGGGNNSTFTNHVVTSSGTDTYFAMAASLASLKGPRHGGANIKVVRMFEDMKQHVSDWSDEGQIADYLMALLNKEAFDRSGLIYGMGHAVYSLSDPRANILKAFVEKLSKEKGRSEEYQLYATVARLAQEIIARERHIYKGVSPNIDFYSGFVYSMLDLPTELFTPIFAIARMVGWSAHRIEELLNNSKIIRPAYRAVMERQTYLPLAERTAE